MGKSTNWALVDLSGAAKTGKAAGATVLVKVGDISLPVAQFTMTYDLNALPIASAQIALGRNARTQQDSEIYSQVQNIKQMMEVTVSISGPLGDFATVGENGTRKQFPTATKPVVIFMGYVSGLSYRRAMGRVSMIINMVGKLFDIAASSGGSKDLVPGAPHDFMMQTLKIGAGGDAFGSTETQFVQFLPEQMNADFSKAIVFAMDHLSKNNLLQTNFGALWCGGARLIDQNSESNAQASAAFHQQGEDGWQGIATFSGSKYMANYAPICPLTLNSAGVDKAATTIGNHVAASLASSSMWGMMVGSVLPAFGCGIISMARGAILAPILPISYQHGITILPEDYADFNMSTQSQRPLNGVGVLSNYVLGTLSNSDSKKCLGGGYLARDDSFMPVNNGMWLFVPAPAWLDDFDNFDPFGKQNANVNRMMSGPSGSAIGVNPPTLPSSQTDTEAWNSAIERYAQLMYATQGLYGRQGTLVGKLRFDIAPGTAIKIGVRSEHLSAGTDQLAIAMHGMVARVTIMLNAEQNSAATSFEITYLRTAEENESSRFSMPLHPFFGDKYFKHAPLVPELSLPPVL